MEILEGKRSHPVPASAALISSRVNQRASFSSPSCKVISVLFAPA